MKLTETEAKFAEIIWENAPLKSTELVRICERILGWKKSTTYTVLRQLCERGIFQNVDTVVSARMSREEFYGQQGRQLVKQAFHGSLPKFLSAFIGQEKMSDAEVEELKALIESHRE